MIIRNMLAFAGFAVGREGRQDRTAGGPAGRIPAACVACAWGKNRTVAGMEHDPVYQTALCSEQQRAGCSRARTNINNPYRDNPYRHMVPTYPH